MQEKLLPHDHGQAIEREMDHMPRTEDFQTVADIFKQLGDGSRIRIFWLLCLKSIPWPWKQRQKEPENIRSWI